jgi:CTP synthase (UTP-ammonia lyase)
VGAVGEPKTKPTQHGVRELRATGLVSVHACTRRALRSPHRDGLRLGAPHNGAGWVADGRRCGQVPDIIVCRSSQPLTRDVVSKISLFCMVPGTHVLGVHDLSNVYKVDSALRLGARSRGCGVAVARRETLISVPCVRQVPVLMHEQRIPGLIMAKLRINRMPADDISRWNQLAVKVDQSTREVVVAIVGKYTGLSDSYLSVTKVTGKRVRSPR